MAIRRTRGLRTAGYLTLLFVMTSTAEADILAPGTKGVRAEMTIAWGSLSDQLTREVAVEADDTWESLARRACGDERFAALVRAMNGGGEAPPKALPKQPRTAWVPPAGRAWDAKEVWYSAYLDGSKYGLKSDVSRTGLRRLAPTGGPHSVFGTVTVALLAHRTEADAARSASLPRERPREALEAKGDRALVVAPSFQATTSASETSKVARLVYEVHCDGIEGTTDPVLGLRLVSTKSFDVAGRALSLADLDPSLLRLDGPAGALAAAALALSMLHIIRRKPAPPPNAATQPRAARYEGESPQMK